MGHVGHAHDSLRAPGAWFGLADPARAFQHEPDVLKRMKHKRLQSRRTLAGLVENSSHALDPAQPYAHEVHASIDKATRSRPAQPRTAESVAEAPACGVAAGAGNLYARSAYAISKCALLTLSALGYGALAANYRQLRHRRSVEFLHRCVLVGWDEARVRQLGSLLVRKQFKRGQLIWLQNSPAVAMCIVEQGALSAARQISVTHKCPVGIARVSVPAGQFGPGSVLGEEMLMECDHRCRETGSQTDRGH